MFYLPQVCFSFIFQRSFWHFLLPGITNMGLERYFGKAQRAHNKHKIWPPYHKPTNFTNSCMRPYPGCAIGSLLERHPGHIVTSIPWGSSPIFTFLTPHNISRVFGKLSESTFTNLGACSVIIGSKRVMQTASKGSRSTRIVWKSLHRDILTESLHWRARDII